MRLHVRATVYFIDTAPVRIDAVCGKRSDLDNLVERLYPEAVRVSTIVIGRKS